MSDAYRATGDYSNYSADELRQAAQRVASDLADVTTNHPHQVRDSYVQQEQDLRTYLLREADRRA